jgi:hypothetical protein
MHIALLALVAAITLAACTLVSPAPESVAPGTGAEGSAAASAVTDEAAASPPVTSAEPSPSPRATSPNGDGATCPVTRPNGAPPPEGEAPGGNYLGNGRLWTVLWPKGMVVVPPNGVEPDGGLGMKFPWWRAPDIHGALHIIGHERTLGFPVRADIPDGYGDTGFQASGIVFPVEGCYQVTGEAGGAQLTFVTMVRPCSAIAEMPPAERALYSICDR